MSGLLELAHRCEAAADLSEREHRDLNEAVLLSVGWSVIDGYLCRPDGTRAYAVPDMLTSLDAAASLVPDDAHWGLGHDATGPLAGWAWVRVKVGDTWEEPCSPPRKGFRHVAPWPRSPALALCAAALRARAAREQAA